MNGFAAVYLVDTTISHIVVDHDKDPSRSRSRFAYLAIFVILSSSQVEALVKVVETHALGSQ
jgi:hypothetical protein